MRRTVLSLLCGLLITNAYGAVCPTSYDPNNPPAGWIVLPSPQPVYQKVPDLTGYFNTAVFFNGVINGVVCVYSVNQPGIHDLWLQNPTASNPASQNWSLFNCTQWLTNPRTCCAGGLASCQFN